jgi:hypothetical protein
MRQLKITALYTLIILITACSSGKVALERGNYFQAVMTAVERLRKNTDHTKSSETLRQAYPLALSYYEDRAKTSLASNTPFKWTAVVESYTTINIMYDEIRRSPGALKIIPNPANYFSQLQEAKQKAAEENYAAGLEALAQNNREKAKLAYNYFKNAHAFVPGYKDVINMIDAALWAATLKVVMEPMPVQAANLSLSAAFFDDKVSEYLHGLKGNQFIRYFTRKEANELKVNPDHIIKIGFEEFTVGQVFLYEKEYVLKNDSVVVGSYLAQARTSTPDTKETTTPPATNTPPKETTTPPKETTPPANQTPPADKGDKNDSKDNAGKTDKNPPADSIATKDRVTICHIPNGNESAKHTLVIAKSALAAHLAHGDVLGTCEDAAKNKSDKGQKSKDQNTTPPTDKEKDKKDDKGNGLSWLPITSSVLYASSQTSPNWSIALFDSVKVYGTVKATMYYSKKTTTSKGVLNFRIIDAKTNAVLAVERMPGEHVWISEWATFNGDERALTPQQLQLCKQREKIPPAPQELFIEFTKPIYDRLTVKIKDFYKGY